MGLTGLGQIQIQLGEWNVADRTLCEAKVRSNAGDREGAVEAASCVRADPTCEQANLFETATTAESAAELLAELSATMEAGVFAAAVARGEVKGLDVVVKELLAERRPHPTAVA